MKKWLPRLALGLAVGIALPLLPMILTQSVGPDADLSGKLGLAGGVSAGNFAVLFLAGILTSPAPLVDPPVPLPRGIFRARPAAPRARFRAASGTYVARRAPE